MKPRKKAMEISAILVMSLAVISMVVVGCGRPSNKDIERAVREYAERPFSISRHIRGGFCRNATVEEVRVIKVGGARWDSWESCRYWLVKVHVKGICDTPFKGRQRFEAEIECCIEKDPYGKWFAKGEL